MNNFEKLRSALEPFAALIDRPWKNKQRSINCVRTGGFVSEWQAISLGDVLKAIDTLAATQLPRDEDITTAYIAANSPERPQQATNKRETNAE